MEWLTRGLRKAEIGGSIPPESTQIRYLIFMDKNTLTQKELLFKILDELRKAKGKIERLQPWLALVVASITIGGLVFAVNSYKEQLDRAEETRLLGQKIDVNSAILELKYDLDTMNIYITDEEYLKYHKRMYARFEAENITNAIRNGSVKDADLRAHLWNVKNIFDSLNRSLDQTIDLFTNAPTKEQKEAEVETGNKVNIENMKKHYPYFTSVLDDLKEYEQTLKSK